MAAQGGARPEPTNISNLMAGEQSTPPPPRSAGTTAPYAVVTRFAFRTTIDEALVPRIEQEFVVPLSQQPGFRAYYGLRASDTEAIAVSVWDSQAEAESALERLAPVTQQLVGAQLAGPPQRSAGRVILHREK